MDKCTSGWLFATKTDTLVSGNISISVQQVIVNLYEFVGIFVGNIPANQ